MKCQLFFQASTESTRGQLPISVYLFSQDSLLECNNNEGVGRKSPQVSSGALSIQRKISEILLDTSNGTAHFGLVRLEYSVHFDQSSYLGWSD